MAAGVARRHSYTSVMLAAGLGATLLAWTTGRAHATDDQPVVPDETSTPIADVPSDAPATVAQPVEDETPPASATPAPLPAEAARTLTRATTLFDRGHYEGALAQFTAAYEQMAGDARRHQVLYNIALCYERSFRYERAVELYERYLREGGADETRAIEVRAILDALDELLGTLRIATNAARFEVWVDGHHIVEAGAVVRLPAGLHTVEIRAEGHLPGRREARVLVGRETRVEIELETLDPFRGIPSAVFWVSASATAATFAAGIVVGLFSMAETRELELRLADDATAWSVTTQDVQALQTLSLAADVLYAVGGVFAVTTLVLGLLTDWRGARHDERAALSVRPLGVLAWF